MISTCPPADAPVVTVRFSVRPSGSPSSATVTVDTLSVVVTARTGTWRTSAADTFVAIDPVMEVPSTNELLSVVNSIVTGYCATPESASPTRPDLRDGARHAGVRRPAPFAAPPALPLPPGVSVAAATAGEVAEPREPIGRRRARNGDGDGVTHLDLVDLRAVDVELGLEPAGAHDRDVSSRGIRAPSLLRGVRVAEGDDESPDPLSEPVWFVPPEPLLPSFSPTLTFTAATVPSNVATRVAPASASCTLASASVTVSDTRRVGVDLLARVAGRLRVRQRRLGTREVGFLRC